MTRSGDPVRVAVVEDDARYREGLEVLLGHASGFELVDAFGSGEAILTRASEHRRLGEDVPWDLVLMDIELPRESGVVVTRRLKAIAADLKIVVLTVFESPSVIVEAIASGADGYLLKKATARELIAQLRSITDGGAPMTAGVARTLLEMIRHQVRPGSGVDAPSRLSLTDRERDVLRCFVRGRSYAQAADELGIALDTVRNHVRGLYRKLQVHSVAEAVHRAATEGLI